ncbi:MAG: SGNH/GDSL hydrolase family protein [Verrucomicrobia bacterium]|nr:SGNH/GDSL hydrolase family protein [Verrucomicrobiota bacterium]
MGSWETYLEQFFAARAFGRATFGGSTTLAAAARAGRTAAAALLGSTDILATGRIGLPAAGAFLGSTMLTANSLRHRHAAASLLGATTLSAAAQVNQPPFDIATVFGSNLLAWWDSDAAYITKDGSNLVSRWTNRSGYGLPNTDLESSAGNRGTWSAAIGPGDKPAVDMTGTKFAQTSNHLFAGGPEGYGGAYSMDAKLATAWGAFRLSAVAGANRTISNRETHQRRVGFGSPPTSFISYMIESPVNHGAIQMEGETTLEVIFLISLSCDDNMSRGRVIIRKGEADVVFSQNFVTTRNVYYRFLLATLATTYYGGPGEMNGYFYQAGFARQLLSALQFNQMSQWLFDAYINGDDAITPFLAFDGDSLTDDNTWDPQYPTYVVGEGATLNFALANRAVPGYEAGWIAPGGGNDRAPGIQYDIRWGKASVVILWIGTNDLATGHQTPQQTIDDIKAYCDARVAEGFTHIIVINMITRGVADVGYATFQANRATFNSLFAAQYSAFADSMIDLAADSRWGPAGAEENQTWFMPDTVHLTQASKEAIADIVRAVIVTQLGL